jgi:Na+/melibiose symporter-like transporter
MIGFALSALFFPMLINLLGDSLRFIVLTVLSGLGAICMLFVIRSNHKSKKKETAQRIAES